MTSILKEYKNIFNKYIEENFINETQKMSSRFRRSLDHQSDEIREGPLQGRTLFKKQVVKTNKLY